MMLPTATYPGFIPLARVAAVLCAFARTIPGTNGLAELQTFSCRECSLWITELADEHPSWNKLKTS